MLVKRWGIQPPYGLSQEDYQTWVDKKQKPIQFRVVNILKSWFDTYWMEGSDDDAKRLVTRVQTFAKEHVATTNTPGAAPLIQAVEQRLRGGEAPARRLVLTLNTQMPMPILPKNMRKLKFLDIDPTEFARQLTIIESKLYGKIKPMECLNKTWGKKLEPDPAANIKGVILHSNQLTNWVAQMILNQADVKRRVIVIKHFVSVADVSTPLTTAPFFTDLDSRNVASTTTSPR
jgi:son of sevenless-like protein